MLKQGDTLGRYTIVAPLGSGGMGDVYRARDNSLERDVAIKMLQAGALSGGDLRRRFHNEALALARLSHEHIAAVYDVGEQDGLDYIVMELVDGEPLSQKLAAGPMPIAEATAICSQVTQALEDAHAAGVVHRDLKPANIMLTRRGQVKVLDFGLAEILSALAGDKTVSIAAAQGIAGTPAYMSPEQIEGLPADARTDIWSLGCVYYECLAGRKPFVSESTIGLMRAIAENPPPPIRQARGDVPPEVEQILTHALKKKPSERYSSAAEMHRDLEQVLVNISGHVPEKVLREKRVYGWTTITACVLLAVVIAGGAWLYRRTSQRHWARDRAAGEFKALQAEDRTLAAFALLQRALQYDPGNAQLQRLLEDNSSNAEITSDPSGAMVAVKDYVTPAAEWRVLGKTPLRLPLPTGLVRWKISAPGLPDIVVARSVGEHNDFNLKPDVAVPAGMSFVPGGTWTDFIGMVGWVGPFDLPSFLIDRYEVTNREFQKFVDAGGYEKKQYWTEKFVDNGTDLPWEQAMERFHDASGRPGPTGWSAGHYPAGRDNFPVTGVSWYEAAAYAQFAGKNLPVLPQWEYAARPDSASMSVQTSNFATKAVAAVGSYDSLGPYGTYDMAGNAREWVQTEALSGEHFILGGDYTDSAYVYSYPQALLPFDRSAQNGFRCVINLKPLPADAQKPVHRKVTDYTRTRPVSDEVFDAYKLAYAYPKTPLHVTEDGVVKETDDYREVKVTYDAAYGDQRVSTYLFLPKRVQPPYQTVLFFPSARVLFLPKDSELGDTQFFDFIVQSGRAVIYPVYEQTYDRRTRPEYAGEEDVTGSMHDFYKDAARALDYAETRPDIDKTKVAYLGVSMGAADGVVFATLLQDRLRTAIFFDGGIFPEKAEPGTDAVDFLPRMKKPVLMVNGRYDFTFPLDQSQTPFFELLGTPPDEKQHLLLDTPHDVTEKRDQLVSAVLAWLDKYLGRIHG